MSDKAILEINDQKYEFPTFVGSENELLLISVRLGQLLVELLQLIQGLKTQVLVRARLHF